MYKSLVIYTKEDVLTMLLKHITDGFDEKLLLDQRSIILGE